MSLEEEHVKLTNAIVSGAYNRERVSKEIEKIEKEYGYSAFNSFTVNRKESPWTMEDLEELEMQSAAGACSKEFYLYMAEVRDYLNKRKVSSGISGIINSARSLMVKYWHVVLIIIAIICLVILVFITMDR